MNQQNKFGKVLITGCSRGIGLELVTQLLEKPIEKIFATVRTNSEDLNKLKEKHPNRISIIILDVSSSTSIKSAFEQVHKETEELDLLINNSGILLEGETPILQVPTEPMLESFQINVIGTLLVTNTFFPLLKKAKKKPLVINISSILSSIDANKTNFNTPYKVSKCALNMLTKNYANECSEFATFCAIHPGWLATDMGKLGGKKPPLTTQQGVSNVLSVIYSIDEQQNGHLLDTNGKDISW